MGLALPALGWRRGRGAPPFLEVSAFLGSQLWLSQENCSERVACWKCRAAREGTGAVGGAPALFQCDITGWEWRVHGGESAAAAKGGEADWLEEARCPARRKSSWPQRPRRAWRRRRPRRRL